MITKYNEKYYNEIKNKITEYKVDYLNQPNPYLQSFIYLINDNVVGLISFSVIYERIELDYIWVEKKFRRMHIASKLMETMFRCKHITSYSLEVATDNFSAINLYKKNKFKIVAVRKNYYNGKDAYLMVREMM